MAVSVLLTKPLNNSKALGHQQTQNGNTQPCGWWKFSQVWPCTAERDKIAPQSLSWSRLCTEEEPFCWHFVLHHHALTHDWWCIFSLTALKMTHSDQMLHISVPKHSHSCLTVRLGNTQVLVNNSPHRACCGAVGPSCGGCCSPSDFKVSFQFRPPRSLVEWMTVIYPVVWLNYKIAFRLPGHDTTYCSCKSLD